MNKTISISPNVRIEEKIRLKHMIPYRVSPSVKYENGNWYYSDYWRQTFRVIDAKYNRYGVLKDAYIRWDDGNYGLICADLDFTDLKLERDEKEIYKMKDIVNSDQVFTGAEIVYWFFMNNIDCFNRKYKGFWKFVDRFSAHRIADFSKYMITAELNNGKYVGCKITKQK